VTERGRGDPGEHFEPHEIERLRCPFENRLPREEEFRPSLTQNGWKLIHDEGVNLLRAYCPEHADMAPSDADFELI
jgi:hypothetical protein